MRKQYFYSVHANADQVQVTNEDKELRGFLNRIQVNRTMALVNQLSKSYMGHSAKKTAIFYSFKYNEFTNLSKMEAAKRLAVHGVKEIHDLKRSTPCVSLFASQEQDLSGKKFFDYVFGTEYPAEYELRVNSPEKNDRLLEAAAQYPENNSLLLEIKNRDRELVCKIVERLWSAQLADSTCRLVILLSEEDIYDRSMELLKQIYLLLPQQVRMNMGFAVDSTFEDIKFLTEKGTMNQYCDLPIHIFTMRIADKAMLEVNKTETDVKYPIVFFDAVHPETESYNKEYFNLLMSLSKKISSKTDAKLSYAEQTVIAEGHKQVSFKNMKEVLTKMDNKEFFWWNRQDLETPEEIMKAYQNQQVLMNDDDLREEAILSFYTQMLPWKDYARCLNEMILDKEYPHGKEIMSFFATELYYGKVLEAAEQMAQKIKAEDAEHERLAVATATEQYIKENRELEDKNGALLAENQEYQAKTAALQKSKEENEAKLKVISGEKQRFAEMADTLQERNSQLRKDLENASGKLEQLKKENDKLNKKNRNLENLCNDEGIAKLKKHAQESLSKAKLFKIISFVGIGAAVVFLIAAIVFVVIWRSSIAESVSSAQQLETMQQAVDELNNTNAEMQKTLEEKDSEIAGLQGENEELKQLIENSESTGAENTENLNSGDSEGEDSEQSGGVQNE